MLQFTPASPPACAWRSHTFHVPQGPAHLQDACSPPAQHGVHPAECLCCCLHLAQVQRLNKPRVSLQHSTATCSTHGTHHLQDGSRKGARQPYGELVGAGHTRAQSCTRQAQHARHPSPTGHNQQESMQPKEEWWVHARPAPCTQLHATS